MGHGAKSSTAISWTLLTVLVVARGKPLEKVLLHGYTENLQHAVLISHGFPVFIFFLSWPEIALFGISDNLTDIRRA